MRCASSFARELTIASIGPYRFGASSLHQRDSRSALFEGYNAGGNDQARRASPNVGGGYGYGGYQTNGSLGVENRGAYRPATPNKKGQYSDVVLNELESQNDAQVEGILGKVKVLKDVSCPPYALHAWRMAC